MVAFRRRSMVPPILRLFEPDLVNVVERMSSISVAYLSSRTTSAGRLRIVESRRSEFSLPTLTRGGEIRETGRVEGDGRLDSRVNSPRVRGGELK